MKLKELFHSMSARENASSTFHSQAGAEARDGTCGGAMWLSAEEWNPTIGSGPHFILTARLGSACERHFANISRYVSGIPKEICHIRCREYFIVFRYFFFSKNFVRR